MSKPWEGKYEKAFNELTELEGKVVRLKQPYGVLPEGSYVYLRGHRGLWILDEGHLSTELLLKRLDTFNTEDESDLEEDIYMTYPIEASNEKDFIEEIYKVFYVNDYRSEQLERFLTMRGGYVAMKENYKHLAKKMLVKEMLLAFCMILIQVGKLCFRGKGTIEGVAIILSLVVAVTAMVAIVMHTVCRLSMASSKHKFYNEMLKAYTDLTADNAY